MVVMPLTVGRIFEWIFSVYNFINIFVFVFNYKCDHYTPMKIQIFCVQSSY